MISSLDLALISLNSIFFFIVVKAFKSINDILSKLYIGSFAALGDLIWQDLQEFYDIA